MSSGDYLIHSRFYRYSCVILYNFKNVVSQNVYLLICI